MRDISQIIKNVDLVLRKNSTTILTGVAISGTVSTAVLSARAATKAAVVLEVDYHETLGGTSDTPIDEIIASYDVRERFLRTWTCYIPPVAVGTATVLAVIGLNTEHNRRNAALVGAYTVLDKGFTEYKEQVTEVLGEKKERAVRDTIAQKSVEENQPTREVLMVGEGEVLFYESLTGRYFKSTMESVRRAQNDINQQILFENYASKNDWFSEIGLPRTSDGDDFGWTQTQKIEAQYSAVLIDGKPAISIGYTFLPIPNYWKVNP